MGGRGVRREKLVDRVLVLLVSVVAMVIWNGDDLTGCWRLKSMQQPLRVGPRNAQICRASRDPVSLGCLGRHGRQ